MPDVSPSPCYARYPIGRFLLDLNQMFICRTCGRMKGECTPWTGWSTGMPYPFVQECNCSGRCSCGERWAGFDFNELITLCHCCGAVLLSSGCRFSVWFCEECTPRIVAINDVCGRYVIPLGRHSFQGSRWNIPVRPKNDEIAEFAETIVSMFERVAQLQSYAPQSALWHCQDLGLTDPQIPLPLYLELLKEQGFHRSHCVMNLCRALKIPVLAAREAGAIA